MGEQHKLIERLKSVRVGSAKWTNALNRLLDAARTEGRGEGLGLTEGHSEPVTMDAVWRACRVIKGDCNNCPASEIVDGDKCIRACVAHATECINTVETGNPWRKESGVKPPWVASPIREPEISREAVIEAIRQHVRTRYERREHHGAYHFSGLEAAADAILNLAPVGGRGEEGSARADLSPASRSPDQHSAGWKSACCEGERCFCGAPAERKVGETLFDDDPTAWRELFGKRVVARHELTAYVCFDHFVQMMGPASVRLDERAALSGAQRSEDDHGEA